MKILHMLPGFEGAGGNVVSQLCEWLQSRDCDVKILLLKDPDAKAQVRLENLNGRVVVVRSNNRYSLATFRQIVAEINQFRPRIVHQHLEMLRFTLPIQPVLWRYHCKQIYTMHTIHGMIPQRSETLDNLSKRLAFLLGVVPIAVSEAVAQSAERSLRIKRPKVIYNGIDIDSYALSVAAPEVVRWKADRSYPSFVYCHIARLSREKRQDVLLRAFQLVVQQDKGALLVIVGDGPELEPLETLARQLRIADNVMYVGYRVEVSAFLTASDVFVLSSDTEGFGLVILEAWAAGKPVISTAVGGVTELITDGEDGLLVRAGDHVALAEAMLSLLRDTKLRHTIRDKALIRAQRFSLASMGAQYLALYMSMLA